jgi:ferredoxin
MPQLTIDGNTHEVEQGKRLVLAIEEAGTNVGHRCGGIAKCTTCRVEFDAGEPDKMTEAEHEVLEEEGLLGQVRLSCQITCDHDMSVRPLFLLENEEEWDNTGPAPDAQITPDPAWRDKA